MILLTILVEILAMPKEVLTQVLIEIHKNDVYDAC